MPVKCNAKPLWYAKICAYHSGFCSQTAKAEK
nr:MAG TPA: hypothetical protein [Caudoviricetes sp.]